MNLIRNKLKKFKDFLQFLKLFHNRKKIHVINNKNILFLQQEDEFYSSQYIKYHDLIDVGIVSEHESVPGNNIFSCWLQGLDHAPPLVHACINSIRENFSDKKLVILDEISIPQYVSLPDYIWEKHKKGIITNAHFSDLVRLSLLCEYGGIWCDATVLCTQNPPKLMTDSPLFVFKAMDLIRHDTFPTICSSWYMAAWSNQRILLLTRQLLFEYWRDAETVGNYFAFHIFLAMAAERYPEDWDAIPFYNNHSPHTLQFELSNTFSETRWQQILSMSPIHKLNHHLTISSDNNFYQHILSTYDNH